MVLAKWVENEFQSIDLGDRRLDARAKAIATQFWRMPQSQPDAMEQTSDKGLHALYRFARNDRVAINRLMEPHFQQSIERTKEHEIVYLAQDTTEIDLTKPERQVEGAGPFDGGRRRGYLLHPVIAFDSQGSPLGMIAMKQWTRKETDPNKDTKQRKRERRVLPVEQKESFRWVEMIRQGKAVARENPSTQYIGLSDSESDLNCVLAEFNQRPENYHLIVRGFRPRTMQDCDIDGERQCFALISDALGAAPKRMSYHIDVSARKSLISKETRPRRKPRDRHSAEVDVRTLSKVRVDLGECKITMNVVDVIRVDEGKEEDPIHWTLLTTLPVETDDEVRAVIEGYQRRWQIETYFFILKSGLRIEQMKYRTLDRYQKAASILMVVAWRVHQTTWAGRNDADSPCTRYVSRPEWKSVYLYVLEGDGLPEQPPTMGAFVKTLACLGGYVNRPQQGEPGCRVVWRGIQKMRTLAKAYRIFDADA